MIRGIDVSHYQNRFNWDKAWSLAFRFAGVKFSDGGLGGDAMSGIHTKDALAAGFKIIPYHFFRFDFEGKAQAAHFVNLVGDMAKGVRRFCLDLEPDNQSTKRAPDGKYQYRDSEHGGHGEMDDEGADKALAALEEIERLTGVTPMLYTGFYFFTGFKNPERFARFLPWIPAYHTTADKVRVPKVWPRLLFWQDAEDFKLEDVDGIDTDQFLGTAEELAAVFAPRTAASPAAPVVPQKPGRDAVVLLQTALNTAGASPSLLVDGIPGPKTQAALRQVADSL